MAGTPRGAGGNGLDRPRGTRGLRTQMLPVSEDTVSEGTVSEDTVSESLRPQLCTAIEVTPSEASVYDTIVYETSSSEVTPNGTLGPRSCGIVIHRTRVAELQMDQMNTPRPLVPFYKHIIFYI